MDADLVLAVDYETQHFGFHPRGFVDGVYNAIQDYLCESLDSMQAFLAEEFKALISKEDVHNRTQIMMQELATKLDKAADRLEVYLNRNVFAIPSHVVLPEDKIHMTNPTTKEQMEDLDKEIVEARLRIIRAKHKKALLEKRIQMQEIVKFKQMEFRKRHQRLALICAEAGIPDLHESVSYNVTKISELQNELKDIADVVQKQDPERQCPD